MTKEQINLIDRFLKAFEIDEKDLFGDSRKQQKCLIRHIFHWWMRSKGFLCSEIGTITNKNHSTVVHSCKIINTYIDIKEPRTINFIQRLSDIEDKS